VGTPSDLQVILARDKEVFWISPFSSLHSNICLFFQAFEDLSKLMEKVSHSVGLWVRQNTARFIGLVSVTHYLSL